MKEKDLPMARVFDLDAFRKREEDIIAGRLDISDGNAPEMKYVTLETIDERLIELGRDVILTCRLAGELGERVNSDRMAAIVRIRNAVMRTLPSDEDRLMAVESADLAWQTYTDSVDEN